LIEELLLIILGVFIAMAVSFIYAKNSFDLNVFMINLGIIFSMLIYIGNIESWFLIIVSILYAIVIFNVKKGSGDIE